MTCGDGTVHTHTHMHDSPLAPLHFIFKSDVPLNLFSSPYPLLLFPYPFLYPPFPFLFPCLLDSASVMLQMFDSSSDGWDSAYYNVLSQDGKLLYGGNLPPQWKKESANELCLKKNQCSIIMLESLGMIGFHFFLILSYLVIPINPSIFPFFFVFSFFIYFITQLLAY